MNNRSSFSYLILIITLFFFGCGGPVKEEKKEDVLATPVSVGEKYPIDTKESVLTWEGSMVLDINQEHKGYVRISKGELLIDKDSLVGGTVEIDMNSMEYGDKANTNTPIKHLKSGDYFDVEKFPIATIAITKVERVSVQSNTLKVTGNLTIKGITKPVTFPAEVEVKDGVVTANGKVVIDRTQWGIRYRSGTFYKNLADQAVSDDIEIRMKVVAKK